MKKSYYCFLLCLFSFLFATESLFASQDFSSAELEKWFNSDAELPVKEVNEGQLEFIGAISGKKILHSSNHFVIDQNSIDNGWVKLTQCYENLDAVPVAEVIYPYRFLQKLKIKSSKNIKLVQISGQSVQLEDIAKNASLCVSAEVRNFYQNEDKSFSLVNGSYHRKFLDGYYPYHLTMKVQFSPQLTFSHSIPPEQTGFQIKNSQHTLTLDSWFEGRLSTDFRFVLKH